MILNKYGMTGVKHMCMCVRACLCVRLCVYCICKKLLDKWKDQLTTTIRRIQIHYTDALFLSLFCNWIKKVFILLLLLQMQSVLLLKVNLSNFKMNEILKYKFL